jgi:hypothetical protein
MQLDVGDVDVTNEFSQGRNCSQGFSLFQRIATKLDLRAQTASLLASFVVTDRSGIANLVLTKLAVGISIAQMERSASRRTNLQNEPSIALS